MRNRVITAGLVCMVLWHLVAAAILPSILPVVVGIILVLMRIDTLRLRRRKGTTQRDEQIDLVGEASAYLLIIVTVGALLLLVWGAMTG